MRSMLVLCHEAIIASRPDFGRSPVENARRLIRRLADSRPEFSPPPRETDRAARPRELLGLIIDDFHHVDHPEIIKSLPMLLIELPLEYCVFILSRRLADDEWGEMMAQRRLAAIEAEELAFSADDIREYFRDYGQELSPEESEEIRSQTRGRAMGVNALAMKCSQRPRRGRSRMIEGDLKRRVWDRWDEKIRLFLMKTAIIQELAPGTVRSFDRNGRQ
ncbi:hypothetical protein LJB86_01710 [Deltaproteobacteria bacterium OttesenSCG-928-M10]|nr:hypothetical protein [Deltaproteobacteria bacterium OttesenSCG-928-M10]